MIMISLKRIFCTCCLLLSVWAVFAQGPSEWKALEKPLNFYLANDLAASLMGVVGSSAFPPWQLRAGLVSSHSHGDTSVCAPLSWWPPSSPGQLWAGRAAAGRSHGEDGAILLSPSLAATQLSRAALHFLLGHFWPSPVNR